MNIAYLEAVLKAKNHTVGSGFTWLILSLRHYMRTFQTRS
jgi:superoxide dismutase